MGLDMCNRLWSCFMFARLVCAACLRGMGLDMCNRLWSCFMFAARLSKVKGLNLQMKCWVCACIYLDDVYVL